MRFGEIENPSKILSFHLGTTRSRSCVHVARIPRLPCPACTRPTLGNCSRYIGRGLTPFSRGYCWIYEPSSPDDQLMSCVLDLMHRLCAPCCYVLTASRILVHVKKSFGPLLVGWYGRHTVMPCLFDSQYPNGSSSIHQHT